MCMLYGLQSRELGSPVKGCEELSDGDQILEGLQLLLSCRGMLL